MSETVERVDVTALLADAHAIVDALQALDLTPCSDDEAVAAVREFERLRRRVETVDHVLILDVEQRGIPARALARGTGGWLRDALKVDIGEANARVRAAHAAGARRSLTGELLPASHPVVAAGQASGDVSARQARVITSMLDTLPVAVCEQVPEVEARLVGFCGSFDPCGLQKLADHERDWLDPDSGYRDVDRRRRDRDLRFTARPDGSCRGSFEGTAELGEFLQVAFDSLGAPKPAADGMLDPRSAGQRRHDAVLDALKVAISSGSLEKTGGILATVVLTMSEQAYATGTGFATTGHGAQVPVREAMSWAGGDYRLFATVLNSLNAVTAYSSTHRLFTEGQRLALVARDGGCSFPGCTAPPGWTQTHHITEWRNHGPTSVDNGCLLCGMHHREFERMGWSVRISDGRPEWTPPRIIDPAQTPIRV